MRPIRSISRQVYVDPVHDIESVAKKKIFLCRLLLNCRFNCDNIDKMDEASSYESEDTVLLHRVFVYVRQAGNRPLSRWRARILKTTKKS